LAELLIKRQLEEKNS